MTAFETTFHVGPDGKVVLSVPPELANRDVRVTVEPASNGTTPASRMTREQWREFLDNVTGSIDDPTFERPPQGEFENREPLS
jgi:hypothetical protein